MTGPLNLVADPEIGKTDEIENEGSALPVRIETLRSGFSPRLAGENLDHVQVLSEADSPTPPILVHRPSMRVIDGMHRLRAAMLQNKSTILAEFFDGTVDDAFLLALKRNATHGYPLTPDDRKAAVRRILETHPNWSDRAIAQATSISAKTVGTVRRRFLGENEDTTSRVGRDGRHRPLDATDGRLRASQLIMQAPDTPLREIASKAGISLGTAQDVRQRLRAGRNPLPSQHRQADSVAVPAPRAARPAERRAPVDRTALLMTLKKDPALRLNELGRHLLKLFEANTFGPARQWERLADTIPEYWLGAVSELVDEYVLCWQLMANQLQRRLETQAQQRPAGAS